MRLMPMFTAAVAMLATSVAAHATPITGNTVTCALSSGSAYSCSAGTAVVGGGTEFTIGPSGVGAVTANFSGTNLVLTFVSTHSYTNTDIKFTDTTNAFSYDALSSFTGLTGFVSGDVTLSGGLLSINLVGVSAHPGDTLTINLVPTTLTPEPSSLLLLGTGMVGVAGSLRRRYLRA